MSKKRKPLSSCNKMRITALDSGVPLKDLGLGLPPTVWAPIVLGGVGVVAGLLYWYFKERAIMNSLKVTPIVEQPPQVISLAQFRAIMPRLPAATAEKFLPYLNAGLSRSNMSNPLVVAAFLANVAHETNELTLLSEIWGPTEAQLRYEKQIPRLGNKFPGDGERFKGRGALQITGRGAYREAGAALGVDIENNPNLVATDPSLVFGTAIWYWVTHKLTPWAESGNFDAVIRGINCGSPTSKCSPYGVPQRNTYYAKARQVLGV